MTLHGQRVGTAAITENLLKRKWSVVILRYLEKGLNDPAEITKREPDISAHVLSERLRTMVRYGIVARFPQPAPSSITEYRLTPFGKKVSEMLALINSLDRQFVYRSGGNGEPRPTDAANGSNGDVDSASGDLRGSVV